MPEQLIGNVSKNGVMINCPFNQGWEFTGQWANSLFINYGDIII